MSVKFRHIQVLGVELRNQIAAGEVVERPASAMKELMENSLDAGARQIDVQLCNGGRDLLSVQDDGSGIPRDELELAITRHATSKITSIDDLEQIRTMGFRGEALASIASVSRFRLVSSSGGEAFEICSDFGRQTAVKPASLPKGTCVEVRDLFGNIPARLKFLKSPATEFKRAQELFVRMALARENVGFRLKNGDKTVLSFQKDEKLTSRLLALWPKRAIDDLRPFELEEEGLRVYGYAASPQMTQQRANRIYLYVNGRPVQDKCLLGAVKEAYKGSLIRRDYPQALLFLEIDPHEVDVNVHPAKTEVRFQNESGVFSACRRAVARALEGWVSSMPKSPLFPWEETVEDRDVTGELVPFKEKGLVKDADSSPLRNCGLPFRDVPKSPPLPFEAKSFPEGSCDGHAPLPSRRAGDFWSNIENPKPIAAKKVDAHGSDVEVPFSVFQELSEEARHFENADSSQAPSSPLEEDDNDGNAVQSTASAVPDSSFPGVSETTAGPVGNPRMAGNLRYLGQIARTYLLFIDDNDALVILDQHAVHERILYDRLLRGAFSGAGQLLLLPFELSLHPAEEEHLMELREILQAMGFAYELRDHVLLVKAIPPVLSMAGAKSLLQDILLGSYNDHTEMFKSVACKAAIKAGDVLTEDEVDGLLKQWIKAEHREFCPHGRPTVLRWDRMTLEKAFKRK
ncbi:MAG: DNA mismatch repair endonuclease MutL [Desulfovibrio sp.]|nr:DNA mismatch repair endonuclease MutL [Desulfovibrio sp.]